jgi:hypothetical protein
MGANAQRRREAKNRNERVKAMSGLLANSDSSQFNRMARPNCSECGSRNIQWSTLGSLADGGSKERQARAAEILPIFGASAEAWSCPDCDGFGAFEQSLHRD